MSNTSKLDSDIRDYITEEDIELSPSQFNNALSMYTSAYIWDIYEESYVIQDPIFFGGEFSVMVGKRPRTKRKCRVCGKDQYKGDNLSGHINKHLRRDKDAVADV